MKGVKAALPKYELCVYMAVLCAAMVWAGSWVFEVSSANVNRKVFKATVKPGWHYFGRKMDVADFEWVMWFSTFRNHILFALSGHVIFAKICSILAPQHRSIMYMAYGMVAILTSMGWTFMALILSHCILLYSISLVKLKWLCFVAGFTSLAAFKVEPFISWQGGFIKGDFELQHVLFYGGCAFTVMRCMSFALENCDRKESNFSFLELLKYNFYLPSFYFGPVMTFDKFHAQANNPDLTRKDWEMWNIRTQAMLHLGAVIMVDILFHFLYVLTIPNDIKLLKHLSDWALAGLAYFNLVYDWVKAAVMFGVINTVSRLDHLEPPKPPKCITLLYVFSETHFDRGINDWLCKYVYDHLGGNHDNIWNQLVATISTFGITALWLGPCEVVFLWSFLNCFGLNLELWLAKFFSLEPFASMEMVMSDAMSRRIRAAFNAANFWMIVLFNILALNSLDFAKLVARRLLIRGFPLSTLTVLFVTYCGVQLVKERERRQALLVDPYPVPAAVTHTGPALKEHATGEEPEKEKAE